MSLRTKKLLAKQRKRVRNFNQRIPGGERKWMDLVINFFLPRKKIDTIMVFAAVKQAEEELQTRNASLTAAKASFQEDWESKCGLDHNCCLLVTIFDFLDVTTEHSRS